MTLTTDTVVFFVTVSGALAGLWWRVEARIRAAERRAEAVERALNSYKLEVEQRFAQRGALKDTEARLIKEIDGLRDDLKGVARALNDLPAQMVAAIRRTASG